MAKATSVVLAHHDTEVLGAIRAELEDEGFRVQATTSGKDALGRARDRDVDAVVLEPLLAKVNGLEVLRRLKEDGEGFTGPIVLTLDDGDTYTENRALICGADGIVKRDAEGRLPRGALAAKLRSLLSESRLVSDRSEEIDELRRILDGAGDAIRSENPILSHVTDSLTGLFNRPYLDLKLAEEFKRTRRFAIPLALVEIELVTEDPEAQEDDSAWRRILNEAAGMLLCESRDIDVIARTGPRSFALLLAHTPLTGARVMVERVLKNLAERGLSRAGSGSPVRAVAGIAPYEGEGLDSWEELARRGEEVLRAARRGAAESPAVWVPTMGTDGGRERGNPTDG
ncbi:MAG: diguanylate cyclase [Planctomycetota bacterium]